MGVVRGWHMKRVLVMAGVAFAFLCASAWAVDGELDPSFGTQGRTVFTVTTDSESVDGAALDSQGRILIAATRFPPTGPDSSDIARLTADGLPDTSFSGDGVASLNWATPPLGSSASDVAVDSADRPLLFGHAYVSGTGADLTVERLKTDGTPDTAFSGDGVASAPLAGTDLGYAGTIDSAGRIYVAGFMSNNFGVARFRSDGTLDNTFSGDGIAQVSFGANAYVAAITIDAQGRAVLAGADNEAGNGLTAVIRLTDSGDLDTSFDGDGRATVDIGPGAGEIANAVVVDGSGRIVVAGDRSDPGNVYAMTAARFRPDGSLDTSFATGGRFTTASSPAIWADALAIDKAGRIILAGSVEGVSSLDAQMLRLLPDGAVDPSFGGGQPLREDFLAPYGSASGLLIDGQGRYVLAGEADTPSGEFAAARFTTSYPQAPPPPGPTVKCAGKTATITGTAKGDVLKGTKKADVIAGLGGNDRILGFVGNDLVCGGGGKDKIYGGKGRDRLIGQAGKDFLRGGPGKDTVQGGPGRDNQHQ